MTLIKKRNSEDDELLSSTSQQEVLDGADDEIPSAPAAPEKKQHYTLREQLEGFPLLQILVIMAARVAEPIGFTSLFPYVFFMVKHLRPDDTEATVARYSGYIAGSFALCQALTGVFWGRLSDKYGRKPILALGLVGSAISMLSFGMAGSYWTALVARSLGGLLNGNVGVLRTVLGEIAVERKHQALAFSTMPLLWQVGCVLGPMLGGSLAMPVEAHPDWFTPGSNLEKTFIKHPFLLPNLVVATLLLSSCVIVFLFLEETHEEFAPRSNRLDPGLKIGDKILKTVSRGRINRIREKEAVQEVSEETGLLSDADTVRYDSDSSGSNPKPAPKKRSKVLTPQVTLSIISYSIFSMGATILDELLPVLFSTSVLHDNKFPFYLGGGLGMNSAEIGSLISMTGTLGIFLMLFFFPWVDGNFGSRRPFQVVTTIFPIFCFIVPYVVFLNRFNSTIVHLGALCCYFSKTIIGSTGFPAVQLIIQRSVTDRTTLGTVNGASQMVAAGGRAIGPIAWGFFMATGQAHHIAWLPWWILALVGVVGALVGYQITEG